MEDKIQVEDKIEVVCFGGGGLYWLNKALIQIPHVRVTDIVGDHDSGGFTGELRKKIGCSGQVGDGTRALCGLVPDNSPAKFIADSWLARFQEETGWGGKSIKNFVWAGLYDQARKREWPISVVFDAMGWMLRLDGHRVFGVTDQPTHLRTVLKNGTVLDDESSADRMGEHKLFVQSEHGIKDVSLNPRVSLSSRSKEAIVNADVITIGPGDIWSTNMGILSVDGIFEAFQETKAKVFLILNLMRKRGETDGYRVEDYVNVFQRRIGKTIDRMIVNGAKVHPKIASLYRAEGKFAVNPRHSSSQQYRHFLVEAPLADERDGKLVHNPLVLAHVLQTAFNDFRIFPHSSSSQVQDEGETAPSASDFLKTVKRKFSRRPLPVVVSDPEVAIETEEEEEEREEPALLIAGEA